MFERGVGLVVLVWVAVMGRAAENGSGATVRSDGHVGVGLL